MNVADSSSKTPTKLNEIEFESAMLVISVVEKGNVEFNLTSCACSVAEESEFYINRCDSDGTIYGKTLYFTVRPKFSNEFWRDSVESVVFFEHYNVLEYSVTKVIYFLNSKCIPTFLSNSDRSNREKEQLLKDLIFESFPDPIFFRDENNELLNGNQGKKIDVINYRRLFNKEDKTLAKSLGGINDNVLSFFVLHPSKKEIISLEKKEDFKSFLEKIEFQRGTGDLNNMACIPYYTENFLELLFIRNVNIADCRLFVNLKHIPSHKSVLQSILEVIEFSVKINILEKIYGRVVELSSKSFHVKDYVLKIEKNNVLKSYDANFASDRLVFFDYQFKVKLIIEQYKKNAKTEMHYLTKGDYSKWLFFEFRAESGSSYDWCYLVKNHYVFDKLILDIESSLTEVTHKYQYIADYLRDSILSKSIEVNIALQRRVLNLTRIAILFAILSIVATVFSEDIHRKIIEMRH